LVDLEPVGQLADVAKEGDEVFADGVGRADQWFDDGVVPASNMRNSSRGKRARRAVALCDERLHGVLLFRSQTVDNSQ
jgi:hypothetical protein